MAQQLRAWTALTKELSLDPKTHDKELTTSSNSRSKGVWNPWPL